jgi:hypothetical protein
LKTLVVAMNSRVPSAGQPVNIRMHSGERY